MTSIQKILSFLLGKCFYAVDEKDAKKLLNHVMHNSIPCVSPRITDSELHFGCPLTSVRKIRSFCAENGIELRAEEYRGIPYIIYKYRHRLGLIVGTFLGLLLILSSGFFVWDIRCEDEEITRAFTMRLREAGVGAGMFIPSLDVYDSEIKFLLLNREYSFIAINLRGTIATVEVKRRKDAPADESGIKYSNLIAGKTGTVVKVEALTGFPAVEAGDIVAPGDLLVSGAFERKNGTTGLVRSGGAVYAQCTQEFTFSVPLTREKAIYSGRTYDEKEYSFFGKTVTAGSHDSDTFGYSDLVSSFRRTDIFGFLRLPLDIYTVTHYEVDFEIEAISFEQASDEALGLFETQCGFLCGGKEPVSVSHTVTYNEKTNSAVLTGELVYITDISVEVPFEVTE